MQNQSITVSTEPTPTSVIPFPVQWDRGGIAVLTPRGEAMVALARFERLFKGLDDSDRAYILDEMVEIAREAGYGR